MSLRGWLLVASPVLTDSNFAGTVVFVIHHDHEGAVGVVLNRPTALTADRLPAGWATPERVFAGGPVEPEIAIALVQPEAAPGEWTRVREGIWVADLEGPALPVARLRVFAGYAGWGPGQLEAEIERADWLVTELEPADVFTDDPAGLWRTVLRRQPDPVRLLAWYPEDPTLN